MKSRGELLDPRGSTRDSAIFPGSDAASGRVSRQRDKTGIFSLVLG